MKEIWLKYKEHIVIIVFPILLLIGMFFISYEKIEIKSITPNHISKVEKNMGMSVHGVGFKNNDIIYINGKPQVTTFGNEGWLTCFIPEDLDINKNEVKVKVKREGGIIDTISNKETLKIINEQDE